MNPEDFKYEGPPIPRALRRPEIYPNPDYPDWVIVGFKSWPEIYRNENGVFDYRLVSPIEMRRCGRDVVEARWTSESEMFELLGSPLEREDVAEFNVTLCKYSELVWIVLRAGRVLNLVLSEDRARPKVKPAWMFVYVAPLTS